MHTPGAVQDRPPSTAEAASLAGLNPQQRSAVEHGFAGPATDPRNAGPLLVLAGAGTGKTMTLAARVARLVLAGADPQRIMLLTFSRRAAHEMERRVGRQLHRALGWSPTQDAPRLPWTGTFHSIGARLIRAHAAQIGLPAHHTIQDRSDAQDLMALVRHELTFDAARSRFPMADTCLAIYSRVVNSQRPLGDVLQQDYPWCSAWQDELRRLFRGYEAHKQRQAVLDYDDLLLYWFEMLCDAEFARRLGERFEHVLVDEYQDTNRLQAGILLALKPDGVGLTVVGDDAQSIYSFRAAQVHNILEFAQSFAPPARTVTLERNYRSVQPILDASNAVIGLSAMALPKRLWSAQPSTQRPGLISVEDESAQAAWVADQVLRHREDGLALKSQAVLFRASHHAAALELELTRRNIPFVKFGGLKFLEAAHVKDVLSVLRWVRNPRHRMAGLRSVRLVPGIGTASAKQLLDAMDAAADPWTAVLAFKAPAAAAGHWPALRALIEQLRLDVQPWPAALADVLGWYRPHLHDRHDDAAAREGDLSQMLQLAAGYGSCESFLTELTLDPPEATSAEAGPPLRDEDYLILSTVHAAKGQEWPAVFVLNVVDGCMPSDLATGHAEQIEEERRLLYVAMTRARRHLHLMVPQRFHVTQQRALGGRHLYATLTRFIPQPLLVHFDRIGPPPPGPQEPPSQAGAAAIDVVARLRDRWA